MTPENEAHHHHHRTGHRWVDLLVPISAIAISVISLGVAIHQQVAILGLLKQAGYEDLWDRLDRARFEMTFKACYCSVFDECWTTDLQTLTPARVEACPTAPDSFSFLAGEQSFLRRAKE